ncbi:EsaB/YukD family protein [Dictyobacter aurantiacus]|uniref:Uncharacterized protein n=1 Tax=Dictyobacter aurantiacus TaxID=1936993 RepID=A0A401ZF17_9CHLR|nr:EsaB/YukD family protein [Dictyobacter aurantiacus]GCE05480.1 hypothetical protein KDAU_28090 [Dictyobacter aurantiacus]
MQTLLVTIIGDGRRFDMQVPAEVPVGKFIPMLLEVCDFRRASIPQRGRPQWTLSVANSGMVLPALASLLDAGVVDGTVLILQDTSAAVRPRQTAAPQQTFRPVNIDPGDNPGNIGVKWNI